MEKNLTHIETRLWELYNFIKERTENNEKTNIKDICQKFPKTYVLNEKPSNYSNCPLIYKDIDILNSSHRVEKIIIKDNNNFKLATETEALDFASKVKTRALKQLKKYYDICAKINSNGQGKLISCADKPIDEKSNAREFVESFIKEVEK